MFAKKKCVAAALCLAVCLAALPMPRAMAADTNAGSEIMPMMEYINTADCDFSISGGVASLYAVVSGYSGVTKCEITVELQEKGLLFWDTVETWECAENSRRAEIDVSHKVTSGEKYRMVATFTVWSGTESETQTMTSKTAEE